MSNKENFLALVSGEDSNTLTRNRWLIENRLWLRKSQDIAILILECIENKAWSQKKLASEMDVSPQMVNKWVKGSENFTLETISKLESVLGIKLVEINKFIPQKEESISKENIIQNVINNKDLDNEKPILNKHKENPLESLINAGQAQVSEENKTNKNLTRIKSSRSRVRSKIKLHK